jgi:hypothetical protein
VSIPYLLYGCNFEINTARTAAYVQNRCDICDDSIKASVWIDHSCTILNWTSEDRLTVDPVSYDSPITDGAPWIDSSYPESYRFLGFTIERVNKPTHIRRTVTPKISGSGGGVLEAMRPTAQQMEFEVLLFACDELAMEYGFRYLVNALAGGGCDDPCTLCELEYRDSCPSYAGETPTIDEYNQGLWILKNVGITVAPDWMDPPIEGLTHYVRRAKFTIASELPWKFNCPVTCVEDETFTLTPPTLPCGDDFESLFCRQTAVSCSVTEPTQVGETAFIINITAGGSKTLSGIEIRIIPDVYGWVCDPDSAPPGYVDPDPCDLVYIEDLPAGYTLSYDTSVESVVVTTNAGVVQDGTPYLSFDGIGGPPTYPVVRCGAYCVQVVVDECSVSDGAKVTIESVHREF